MAEEIIREIQTEFTKMSSNAKRAEIYNEKETRRLLKSYVLDYCNTRITRMPNQWWDIGFQITQAIPGSYEYFNRERERVNDLKTLLCYICERMDYQDLLAFYGNIRKYGLEYAVNKYNEKVDKLFGSAVIPVRTVHVRTVESKKEGTYTIIGREVVDKEIPRVVYIPIDEEDNKNKGNRK